MASGVCFAFAGPERNGKEPRRGVMVAIRCSCVSIRVVQSSDLIHNAHARGRTREQQRTSATRVAQCLRGPLSSTKKTACLPFLITTHAVTAAAATERLLLLLLLMMRWWLVCHRRRRRRHEKCQRERASSNYCNTMVCVRWVYARLCAACLYWRGNRCVRVRIMRARSI